MCVCVCVGVGVSVGYFETICDNVSLLLLLLLLLLGKHYGTSKLVYSHSYTCSIVVDFPVMELIVAVCVQFNSKWRKCLCRKVELTEVICSYGFRSMYLFIYLCVNQ